MKKIVIIGGGFAGLSVVKRLSGNKGSLDVVLVDKQSISGFLPLLPDTLGRAIDPGYLVCPIETFTSRYGFRFIQESVNAINLEKKEVMTTRQRLSFDYLVIASGCETNFYANQEIQKRAFTLDSAEDSIKLIDALTRNEYETYLIAGGGYTGIEIATNLRRWLDTRNKTNRVVVVERASAILGPLPQWMRQYVEDNLKRLRVEVLCPATVEKIDDDSITLSNREVFRQAMFIWAAGVRGVDCTQGLAIKKNPQGRILVDDQLMFQDACFAVGDAAVFSFHNNALRMAVQFAIAQGEVVADNILNLVRQRPLRKFRPVDLGYIIPMANNQSCGIVLGFKIKGRAATLMHFLMCVFRSYGLRNRWGIIRGLMTKGKNSK
ncbi:MAG: FAD-dependent oxidoreductase [Candidatus Omnitrophota bacterium]|jgi:NADH dehydrogenase